MDEIVLVILRFVWFLLSPERLFFISLLFGVILLYCRWIKVGRIVVAGVTVFGFIISIMPVANWVINPLEQRFPIPDLNGNPPNGIIVLSGAENAAATLKLGQVVLSESAERLIVFVSLARRFPYARLVVSDSSEIVINQNKLGAETARQLFGDMGLELTRVEFEDNARNTYENAVYTKELIQPLISERWLLVTSAFHMPRAVACFRKQGLDVVPYPVDYRGDIEGYSPKFNPLDSLALLSLGLKEWLGLISYWLMGRTEVLFP